MPRRSLSVACFGDAGEDHNPASEVRFGLVRAVQHDHHARMVLDVARLTEVVQGRGAAVLAGITVDLTEGQDRNAEVRRQGLEAPGDLADLLGAGFAGVVGREKLEVVHDDQVQRGLPAGDELAGADGDLADGGLAVEYRRLPLMDLSGRLLAGRKFRRVEVADS